MKLLTDQEIVERLQRFRFHHSGRNKVPLERLGKLVGVSRYTLYDWMAGERGLMEKYRARISAVLEAIENGTISFKRKGKTIPYEVVITPPDLDPPEPRDMMTRAEEWEEGCRCRRCDGKRWSEAVREDGRRLMVCVKCVPENQWRAIGLRRYSPASGSSRRFAA